MLLNSEKLVTSLKVVMVILMVLKKFGKIKINNGLYILRDLNFNEYKITY